MSEQAKKNWSVIINAILTAICTILTKRTIGSSPCSIVTKRHIDDFFWFTFLSDERDLGVRE